MSCFLYSPWGRAMPRPYQQSKESRGWPKVRPCRRQSVESFRRGCRWKGNRLDLGQVELAGGMVDIKPDDIAVGVEVDNETFNDLSCLNAGGALELDIKTIGLRIVVHSLLLHHANSL